MRFGGFLESGWNDHADRPGEVAERLAASLHLVDSAERVPPFARLVTHVFGEHLGDWRRGIGVLEALRASPAFDGSASVAGSLAQGVATLRYAGGDRVALDGLTADDQICVLGAAASALAGRGDFAGALAAYSEALRRAAGGLAAQSPALRSIAI